MKFLAMEDPAFPIPKLPNELIIEILTWLPVKPLLKFKCVCKPWRALISSPQFVRSHLESSKSDPNFTRHRVLMQSGGNFKQFSANSLLYHEPVAEAFGLSSPLHPGSSRDVVVGSCNGLLCLSSEFPIPGNNDDSFRRDLILWNPSTRIYKVLPGVEVKPRPGPVGVAEYGFGYDKSSDDYKVVRLFDGDTDEVMLQVYSLRSGQWKTVKNSVKPHWEMDKPALFLKGKLYWVGMRADDPREDLFVVCFDLETEDYEMIMQLPKCETGYLGESGGSLMLVSIAIGSFHTEVWILEGCCVAGNGNWSKVMTIPHIMHFSICTGLVLCGMNRPVVFFDCPDIASILMIEDTDRTVYPPRMRNTGGFRVCGAYIESLVCPLGW